MSEARIRPIIMVMITMPILGAPMVASRSRIRLRHVGRSGRGQIQRRACGR